MNRKRFLLLIFLLSLLVLIISIPAYATNEATLPELMIAFLLFFALPRLIMEYLLVKILVTASVSKTIFCDIIMNIGSLLFGTPLVVIFFRLLSSKLMFYSYYIDAFNLMLWIGPWLAILSLIFIYALIEKIIIEKIFKNKLGKKVFWWLVLTNSLSFGVFFVCSYYFD